MISGMETNKADVFDATLANARKTYPRKTPQMEAVLEDMGSVLFGRSRKVTLDNQLCISCGCDANHFRDELSRKEYRISCMCQGCQDKVFS